MFHEADVVRIRAELAKTRANVTFSSEAQVFSRGGGQAFPANPRGTEGLINSAPRRIPWLCSSSAAQNTNKLAITTGEERLPLSTVRDD